MLPVSYKLSMNLKNKRYFVQRTIETKTPDQMSFKMKM